MAIVVEACVDSVVTSRAAALAGAKRVELCGPGEGGTTPSAGLIAQCRAVLGIPMHVMIRPNTGGFCYDEDELQTMERDIDVAHNLGADGVVFGVLGADRTLNVQQMSRLVTRARPMRVICHRAFDLTPDPDRALDVLMAMNVDGVLTSGHAASAVHGLSQLQRHVKRAGVRLSIMAGGNVRAHNVCQIVAETGIREVHARATDSAVFSSVVVALQGCNQS